MHKENEWISYKAALLKEIFEKGIGPMKQINNYYEIKCLI